METIAKAALIFYVVFFALFALAMFNNKKRKDNASENKMDGELLDWRDIPQEDVHYVSSEQPFIDGYQSLN